VVCAALAVLAGLKEPQTVEVPQETVHATPALAVSFVTVATRGAVPLMAKEAGGNGAVSATVIAVEEVMVIGAVLCDTLASSATVAVIVTADGGTAAGAVYVTGVPLAVFVGLKVPQALAVVDPQVADQLAPLVSLVMVAVMDVILPIAREVGGVLSEIVGVVVPPPELWELPPQAASAPIRLRVATRRIDLPIVMMQ
jgi:hypothetical protein